VICSVLGIAFIQAEPISGQTPSGFRLVAARVGPSPSFADGRPVGIRFRLQSTEALDLPVDVIRAGSGRRVRRYVLHGVTGGRYRVALNTPRRAGRYVVRIGGSRAGSVVVHSHYFPVRGQHFERGAIGLFGAPRSGGRTHEGFDVVAACGTPLAAARGGRVVKSVYDPVLYGNLLIVRSGATHRDYWYAHLARRSRFGRGARVRTGERIGRVGATGNARTVGCHLHFEIHAHGRPLDPARELHAWDRWS
jgi:murein DD-endopeptidase MepM/ murein hydrolase activator NlpD